LLARTFAEHPPEGKGQIGGKLCVERRARTSISVSYKSNVFKSAFQTSNAEALSSQSVRRQGYNRLSATQSDPAGDRWPSGNEISMNDRLFPARPILAVSTAVFRDGRALIIRRARPPLIGHFSLPGGGVEVGETMAAAVARELMEEVGIEAEIVAFNRHVEAIIPEGERVRAHFVIASFVARWMRGEPQLSDEVDAVEWVDPFAGLPSPTTPELSGVLVRAARIEGQTAVVTR
jgi:8-oxo-dGTP diphosphatase